MMRIALALATTLTLAACNMIEVLPGQRTPDAPLPEGATRINVVAPGLGLRAPFARSGRNGAVVTWTSAARQALSLQDGILVASRGFGADLMRADAGPTLAALARGGGEEVYVRSYYYLDGENREVEQRYGCQMKRDDEGLRETCANPGASFANLYVTDTAGRLLRSAQWVGVGVGAVAILP